MTVDSSIVRLAPGHAQELSPCTHVPEHIQCILPELVYFRRASQELANGNSNWRSPNPASESAASVSARAGEGAAPEAPAATGSAQVR